MNNLLTIEFEKFFGRVNLSENQNSRIESAVKALSTYLIEKMDLDLGRVFIHGSYSTNTTVKPVKVSDRLIDYDVDLVALCANGADSPTLSLEKLEEVISKNEVYKDKVEKDEINIPCIRLRYADEESAGFHIDILPAVETESSIIYIPRKESWEISDPKSFTRWVLGLGERYRRTLMILKRWKDVNGVPIKSIVLQVMVAHNLGKSAEDSMNVYETFNSINNYLLDKTDTPVLMNPVLNQENLTSRWQNSHFIRFKKFVEEASELATSAILEKDHDVAAALWQKLLGKDFIFNTAKKISIETTLSKLGDISHVVPLEKVFLYSPVEEAVVNIEAELNINWEKFIFPKNKVPKKVIISRLKRGIKSGEKLPISGTLDYYARVYGAKNLSYDIYWQVVNTEDEARTAGGLRGEIFPSKDPINKKYNRESTLYHGTHWIECFVVVDQVCISRSGKFYIYIE